jgi:hypothetical protein
LSLVTRLLIALGGITDVVLHVDQSEETLPPGILHGSVGRW